MRRYAEMDWHAHGLLTPEEQREYNRALNKAIDHMEERMTKNPAAPDAPPAAEQAEVDPFEGLKPGRVVYYWPRVYESRNCAPGPWAAIVTAVGPKPGETTLNVQMPAPAPVGEDPVCRFKEVLYSPEGAEGCWNWMFPGQATRYKPDRTA